MDKHVISTWTEKPDDVGGRIRIKAGAEAAFTYQVADDIGGALSMLRQLRFPQGAGVRIDARGAPDRLMNSRHPAVHLGDRVMRPVERQLLVAEEPL